MSSSNSSKIEDQLTIVFQGVMEEAMNMLQAKEATAAAASSSIVIVKWLISGCSMTTSMTIACTPFYFRRRYHIRMTLFLSIMHKLSEISPYFYEKYDATDCVA
jgi:hypothetical protein